MEPRVRAPHTEYVPNLFTIMDPFYITYVCSLKKKRRGTLTLIPSFLNNDIKAVTYENYHYYQHIMMIRDTNYTFRNGRP